MLRSCRFRKNLSGNPTEINAFFPLKMFPSPFPLPHWGEGRVKWSDDASTLERENHAHRCHHVAHRGSHFSLNPYRIDSHPDERSLYGSSLVRFHHLWSGPGKHLCPYCHGLHHGLWNPPYDQLRPQRGLHERPLYRLLFCGGPAFFRIPESTSHHQLDHHLHLFPWARPLSLLFFLSGLPTDP